MCSIYYIYRYHRNQVTANSAEENKTITNGQFDIPFWLASCGRRKDMQEVHVACPCCKNKRLFDADPKAVEGIIKIKCPICKSVIAVSFHKKKVRTERIGVWAIITTRAWRSIDVKIICILSGSFFMRFTKNGTISSLKREWVNRRAGKAFTEGV